MRKSKKRLLALFLIIGAVLCVYGASKVITLKTPSTVNSADHQVTFDYNSEEILDYIPQTTTILNSLNNYSITVSDGEYASETRSASSLLNSYYTYEWQVDGITVDLSNYEIKKDTVFSAKWTAKKYTVYFNFESDDVKNNISNLITSLDFTVESPRIDLYEPVLEHYAFAGWYDGGLMDYLYIPAGSIGDKTLTAKFTPKEYLIVYNNEGNTVTYGTYTVLDEDVVLSSLSRTGYKFLGWYLDENHSQSVSIIDCSEGGNIFLYPLWQKETYQVTYILPNGETQTVEVEYGEKAQLPKVSKSIFQVLRTSTSRDNITENTVITVKLVNIWYVYVLVLVAIAGITTLVVFIVKRRNKNHNKLRLIYHSNSKGSNI